MIGTIVAIARQELLGALRSPVAWVMYAALQFILAWQFLAGLETYLQLQPQLKLMVNPPGVNQIVIAPVIVTAGFLFLLSAPLITMRAVADERRARTLVLYLKAPIAPATIVLGKFLGCLAQLLPVVLGLALMFGVLALTTPVDGGQLLAGLAALLLVGALFVSMGLFISTLTSHPAAAAFGTLMALLLIWLLDWQSSVGAEQSWLASASALNQFQGLVRGLVDTGALAYFGAGAVCLLALASWRLAREARGGAGQ